MDIVKSTKTLLRNNDSNLCVVGVFLGIGLTIFETWRARPKFDKIMSEYKVAIELIKSDSSRTEEEVRKALNAERVDMFRKVAIVCLPMGIAGLATGGSALAGRAMDARKISKMAATMEMGDIAYRKLESRLAEALGDKEAKEIVDSVKEDSAKTALDSAFKADSELSIIEQGRGGSQVYYDPFYDKLFRSDDHTIVEVCLTINNKMSNKPFGKFPYAEYSEFYDDMWLSVPGASHYFYFDADHQLKPNLNNTIKWGEISCTILDWYDSPKCGHVF